jgi:hypothetical protein
MNYLSPSEYEQYGIESATPEAWVGAASKLIDSHCRRTSLALAEYTERMRLRPGAQAVRVSYLPLAAENAIIAARGRFTQPRKGEYANADLVHDVARAFSLPGAWSQLDVSQFDYDPLIGEVFLPAYALGIPFNEVEITYSAGNATIPDEIKFACAQIVKNAQATPGLNVRSGKVDTMKLDYFADSLLDSSVQKMLAPYMASKVA